MTDPKKLDRFKRMYAPDTELPCALFEDVEAISKESHERESHEKDNLENT